MIDRDHVHAAVQFTSTITLVMCGVAMLMIWQATRHEHVAGIPRLKLLLGVLLLVVGFKQGFWSLQGALKAADMNDVAEAFSNHWIPPVFNAAITCVGMTAIALIGSIRIGWLAYASATCACAGLLAIGWLLPR